MSLVVQDLTININPKNSILVSRNSPIALVVGVAGFLGSHLADALLGKGIQVVGIDDFSTGKKQHLNEAIKSRNFHLINASVDDQITVKLPRLDYAFLVADSFYKKNPNSKGLHNFLTFIKENKGKNIEKPKVILVSTINLYNNKLNEDEKNLKEGEIKFAKFIKYYKINARIVRLAALFGPRMNFKEEDPLVRLIQAALLDKLQNEQTSLDFTTRSLYVSDAIDLLVKAVLLGGTSHKIYDGVNIEPIKVSEIKQILLDPLWHENRGFEPTELPPWTTPNLDKTVKELSWKPKINIIRALKNTMSYFKDNNIEIPEVDEEMPKKTIEGWSFQSPVYTQENKSKQSEDKTPITPEKTRGVQNILQKIRSNSLIFITAFIISTGLILPILQFGIGIINLQRSFKSSELALGNGDFSKANQEIKEAQQTLINTKEMLTTLSIVKRIGLFGSQINTMGQLEDLMEEGVEGLLHANLGTQALFKTTKIISGEINENPDLHYKEAQSELTTAGQKIGKVQSRLSDPNFSNNLPGILKPKIHNTAQKLEFYANLIEKARAAAYLLPTITAVNSKKTYLILLQNNLELRAAGGFIGSFAKLSFENGRIREILVDDIYNLDGGLGDVIEPPKEIRDDLGQNRLFLRDSNFEPDFPTAAREAEFFYKKEAGETVNGVFALDLSGSGKLLSAVGGLDLPEYGEHVDGNNLFERAITHAEVNFFPGSQAKKNYLTSMELSLFNKIFYLSNQNWPSIIKAVGESLEQKHLLVYLADPQLFSYLASENWAGVMPRGTDSEGGFSDFLAPVEANYGANKANFYLTRSYKLDTTFGKEGQVSHKLNLSYRNNSPSDVFPAGKYKNRFKIYLPVGTKITKALWGETDITHQSMASFSDYGRAGYSVLLELNPKEQKNLILDYTEAKRLQFQDGVSSYRLDVVKQSGTDKDSFEWHMTYPINYQLEQSNGVSSNQELTISTDLQKDRSFMVKFKQK